MRKLTLTCLAAGALLVPVTAAPAKPNDGNASKAASKACKAERETLGRDAFAEKYGTGKNRRNALGKCISQSRRSDVREQREKERNATKDCKAERELDRAAFEEKYGSNRNRKNALGKCVSRTVKNDESA